MSDIDRQPPPARCSRSRTSRSRSRRRTGSCRPCAASSFDIYPGETLAIVGESGPASRRPRTRSSTCCPAAAQITGGQVLFEGRDLTELVEADDRGGARQARSASSRRTR